MTWVCEQTPTDRWKTLILHFWPYPDRWGGECPWWLWMFITFSVFNQMPPNFNTLPKNLSGIIWYDKLFLSGIWCCHGNGILTDVLLCFFFFFVSRFYYPLMVKVVIHLIDWVQGPYWESVNPRFWLYRPSVAQSVQKDWGPTSSKLG